MSLTIIFFLTFILRR
jgi:hypothetical protein